MAKGDKIKGGFADKVSAEDIAKKHKVSVKDIEAQIKMGRKVEMEHVDDENLAEEIALDHLYEIPDYYTRLDKMEKEAKKENITEFARRMRELAGLSESNQKKSIHTIQEGKLPGEKDENGMPIPVVCPAELMGVKINESEESEFETHKFEQKTIEEGEEDGELYSLNENTIIVLDFLKEEKSVSGSYEGGYDSHDFEDFLKSIGAKELKTIPGFEKGLKIFWTLPEHNLILKVTSFREPFSTYNTADFYFEIFKKNMLNFKKNLSTEEVDYANGIIKELTRLISLNDKYIQSDYFGED